MATKKERLIKLFMLVVVEAIFDTKDRLSRCALRRRLSAVKCKIIRHCDRNYFIYNLMKKIHIVEHKSVQKGENIDLLVYS